MKIQLGAYNPILSLWTDREDEQLAFHEIKKAMEDQGWYERKIIRYLKKMVELRLLEKQKDGTKGSRALYKTTSKTHEYEAQSFFDRVRRESLKKGYLNSREDSFLIYGLPPKKDLSKLEKEVYEQIQDRIYQAFYDLYSLKQSIAARNEAGEPMDTYLLSQFLLEKVSGQFRQQLWNRVYDVETDDIKNILNFAKQVGVEISDPEKYLKVEERWKSPDVSVCERPRSGPLSSFEEACLAVLVMLNPSEIGEYGYDSYNYLKHIIELLENQKKMLNNSDLVIFARQFLKRERLSKMTSTKEYSIKQRILGIRRWPWLKLKLGTETVEKLTRIIYHLWRKQKQVSKRTRITKPQPPEIHIVTEEEHRKELEEIVRESQKIDL